jgi:hypothetical protein
MSKISMKESLIFHVLCDITHKRMVSLHLFMYHYACGSLLQFHPLFFVYRMRIKMPVSFLDITR